jgi:serine phosphatase RsbU (regulator of sigma subunit)/pSer/pThr/pTyr-binding forkhead associated (FHA) protein
MAAVTLTISGRGKTWQVEPNPQGTIIGRSPRCNVVTESRDVSREHARIFQDPFGRWIIEDLGSSNGVFVNGKRVEAYAVFAGDHIAIGPFSLSVAQSFDQQIKPDESIQTGTNIIIEEFETEVFYGQDKQNHGLSPNCTKLLGEIIERLSELTSSSALYPQVCKYMAPSPKTVAIVFRVPKKTEPLPKSPDILACHFGDSPDDTASQTPSASYPSRLAFRMSHQVIEKARTSATAVMAKSIYSSDLEITSTIVDEHSPRAVICSPLGDVAPALASQEAAGVDMLYLDIPIDDAAKTTPEQTFEFVRAVAREIILARKRLILMQVKAERSILDHELSLARKIHTKLAPTMPQDMPSIELALHYKPVMWVGGDYCDVWLLKDGLLAFAIGDVTSNGLPTAIAVSCLKTVLRTTMSFCSDLSEVTRYANSHLTEALPQPASAALFLGLFDASKGTLQYVNAGYLQPLIVRPPSAVLPLGQSDNPPLGTANSLFRTKVETLQPAAQLIVFTDGVTKVKSPTGEEFGTKRLMNLLKTANPSGANRTVELITKAITDFRQTLAQQDDITLFVLINRK